MSRNLGLQLAQRCRAAARTRFPQLGGRLWSERLPQQSRNYAQAAKAPLKTATALPDGTVTAGSTRVLFERAPGWYIRWMWALIGLDLIWCGNASELVWNQWTRRVTKTPDGVKDEYERRPLYQRASLAGFIVIGGSCLAAGMFLIRARVVKRLLVQDNKLWIESCANKPGKGTLVEKSVCTLSSGRDDTEMILRAKGVRGHYWVGLNNARVDGRAGGLWDVRKRLQEGWYSVKLAGRWKTGGATGQWSS